jgi:hypothetical protein
MRNTKFVILLVLLLAVFTLFAISGCSSTEAEEPATESSSNDGGVTKNVILNKNEQENLLSGNKIIKSGSAVIETESFDELVEQIVSTTLEIGGYIEYSYIGEHSISKNGYIEPRNGTFTIRIPTSHFENYLGYLEGYGRVRREQYSAEDISDVYFDSESHLKSLRIQEERLLALLEKEGSLEDLLKIERELTSVRYEIEGLTGELQKWDKLISLSTLEIIINEVAKENENINAPATFGGELLESVSSGTDGLIRFLKGSLLVFLSNWPIMAVIAIGIYFNRKRIMKFFEVLKRDKL